MSMTRGSRFGSYEVTALIGVGGMGEVYRATDPALKRDVALKVLPESFLTDANRLARLQREAEVLASLNHANVAQIYGLERSDGRSALVMELVDGVTLAERIGQGPLPTSEALDVALQIAAGLEAAHERGIVHRDLKPANIKLTSDGNVKVLDFGIAKALDVDATTGPQRPVLTTPAMTEAGMVLGTAAYMAPEQARGKPVDKRADIWAFGCVLYEMLTGKATFLGDDVTATLARVLEREPEWAALPSVLAPAVRRTLELCLKKDPKKRLRDIGDVRLALEGELLASPGRAEAKPLWRRALPVAAALVVGALAAGLYVATLVEPAAPAASAPALPITRFDVTPPASAPLANLAGSDLTISPDGTRLAYFALDVAAGGVALYVRELDGLEARLVPGTEIATPGIGNMNPFFSADGRSVGFLFPERAVVRVALDGAPPLKIADTPRPFFMGAHAAADGTLVLSSGRSLQRVSAEGGDVLAVMAQIEGSLVASPMLLPGGRAVLFGLMTGGVDNVAVLDLDTGERKTLVQGWSPTYAATGHLVFARGTALMAAPFDVVGLALTGDPVTVLQGVRHIPDSPGAADYALSATGTLTYVPSRGAAGSRGEVVWVDRTGEIVGRAIPDVVEAPRDPRLSPDGSRLALITGQLSDGDLWSYDLGGRPPIRLAFAGNNRSAVWSPDGKQIAFSRANSGGPAIHTVPADGSVLTSQPLRAEGLNGVVREWSAAGEIILVSYNTAADIVATPAAAAGDVRKIVVTEYAEFDPALSPNGRWLAYASNRTGPNEVWVQGYPDGVAVRVSASGGYEPRWSADSRELFYRQGNALMAVAVETESSGKFLFAAPVQLFNAPQFVPMDPGFGSYDVARDGRFLMIQAESASRPDGASSIVVVQNWFEELRRRVPAD